MTTYCDDNFGVWTDMGDPDTQDFYFEVQEKTVLKQCLGCGRTVKILPKYAYCNQCANQRESGLDY